MLGIIIQTSHGYGADVALVAGSDRTVLAKRTVVGDVTTALPERVAVKFCLSDVRESSAIYQLNVVAFDNSRYDDVSVELATGTIASFSGGDGWTESGPGRFALDGGALSGPNGELPRKLTFSAPGDACTFAHPAVVVTAKQAARTLTTVVIADAASLGNCVGQGGGGTSDVRPLGVMDGAGAAPASLPNTGTGQTTAAPDIVLVAALLVVGIAIVSCGSLLTTASSEAFRRQTDDAERHLRCGASRVVDDERVLVARGTRSRRRVGPRAGGGGSGRGVPAVARRAAGDGWEMNKR